ncbi:cytochrome c oxidase subunit II [Halobacillus fulvus]|nr:cytochrome c oxidase subunit II [Halobacillus fulvus]
MERKGWNAMKKTGWILTLFLLSGCSLRVLDPASPYADKITRLIYLSFGIMMLVFVVVMILFVHFLKKFHETSDRVDEIPVDESGNRKLEITWTVLPVLLLVILAVPTVTTTYQLTSGASQGEGGQDKERVIIHVKAEQFRWEFTYEGGEVSYDKLVLPLDKEVELRLTSEDVIHSFWAPNLAGKIDVFPDKETRLVFTANKLGDFQGKCAEFCGSHHALMRFETTVMEASAYETWLQDQ